jgi:hypothetical protein
MTPQIHQAKEHLTVGNCIARGVARGVGPPGAV